MSSSSSVPTILAKFERTIETNAKTAAATSNHSTAVVTKTSSRKGKVDKQSRRGSTSTSSSGYCKVLHQTCKMARSTSHDTSETFLLDDDIFEEDLVVPLAVPLPSVIHNNDIMMRKNKLMDETKRRDRKEGIVQSSRGDEGNGGVTGSRNEAKESRFGIQSSCTTVSSKSPQKSRVQDVSSTTRISNCSLDDVVQPNSCTSRSKSSKSIISTTSSRSSAHEKGSSSKPSQLQAPGSPSKTMKIRLDKAMFCANSNSKTNNPIPPMNVPSCSHGGPLLENLTGPQQQSVRIKIRVKKSCLRNELSNNSNNNNNNNNNNLLQEEESSHHSSSCNNTNNYDESVVFATIKCTSSPNCKSQRSTRTSTTATGQKQQGLSPKKMMNHYNNSKMMSVLCSKTFMDDLSSTNSCSDNNGVVLSNKNVAQVPKYNNTKKSNTVKASKSNAKMISDHKNIPISNSSRSIPESKYSRLEASYPVPTKKKTATATAPAASKTVASVTTSISASKIINEKTITIKTEEGKLNDIEDFDNTMTNNEEETISESHNDGESNPSFHPSSPRVKHLPREIGFCDSDSEEDISVYDTIKEVVSENTSIKKNGYMIPRPSTDDRHNNHYILQDGSESSTSTSTNNINPSSPRVKYLPREVGFCDSDDSDDEEDESTSNYEIKEMIPVRLESTLKDSHMNLSKTYYHVQTRSGPDFSSCTLHDETEVSCGGTIYPTPHQIKQLPREIGFCDSDDDDDDNDDGDDFEILEDLSTFQGNKKVQTRGFTHSTLPEESESGTTTIYPSSPRVKHLPREIGFCDSDNEDDEDDDDENNFTSPYKIKEVPYVQVQPPSKTMNERQQRYQRHMIADISQCNLNDEESESSSSIYPSSSRVKQLPRETDFCDSDDDSVSANILKEETSKLMNSFMNNNKNHVNTSPNKQKQYQNLPMLSDASLSTFHDDSETSATIHPSSHRVKHLPREVGFCDSDDDDDDDENGSAFKIKEMPNRISQEAITNKTCSNLPSTSDVSQLSIPEESESSSTIHPTSLRVKGLPREIWFCDSDDEDDDDIKSGCKIEEAPRVPSESMLTGSSSGRKRDVPTPTGATVCSLNDESESCSGNFYSTSPRTKHLPREIGFCDSEDEDEDDNISMNKPKELLSVINGHGWKGRSHSMDTIPKSKDLNRCTLNDESESSASIYPSSCRVKHLPREIGFCDSDSDDDNDDSENVSAYIIKEISSLRSESSRKERNGSQKLQIPNVVGKLDINFKDENGSVTSMLGTAACREVPQHSGCWDKGENMEAMYEHNVKTASEGLRSSFAFSSGGDFSDGIDESESESSGSIHPTSPRVRFLPREIGFCDSDDEDSIFEVPDSVMRKSLKQ